MAWIARWLTFDAFKSIAWGVGLSAVFGALVVFYHDVKGGATAQAKLECAQTITEGNSTAIDETDTLNRAAETAAQIERDKHREDGGRSEARARALERALAGLPAASCYPPDVAKALAQ